MIFGVEEEDESIRVHEGEISHEDEKEEDMVKRLLCDEN
jgi:hypothetical protein